jgi:threonine/homoserine/homoserine lactone efflux protein
MTLFLFLIQVFVISLSGALSPGPVTAAAIATGQRSRHAGALLAVGHGILEFPLMILIMLGMGKLLKLSYTQIAIGLAGGIVLLIMAIQMLAGSNTDKNTQGKISTDKPILTGFILSASNPYFLLWWATVGLALATTARQLGIWAFALFTITHWLCDLVWLEALSLASFKGTYLLGPRSQKIVLLVCSLAMLFFGLFFIYRASTTLFLR